MGKHSLPESPGFWRSVIIAGAKYLIVAAIIAGLGFGIYKLVGSNDDPADTPTETLPPLPTDPEEFIVSPIPEDTAPIDPSASPGGTTSATPSTTTTTAVAGASTTIASGPTTAPASGSGRLQILDGGGSGIRAAKAKQKIEGAGYEVVFTGATTRNYEKTTVFYQPGNEPLARQIATALGATEVAPAPANLDKSIPVAAVIGTDYPG